MNWVNSLLLMRLHKPVGIMLLWFPTAWALWIANQANPPIYLSILFFLGTFFMRSAGCVINDIADRQIDSQVQRTRKRPLAAGKISLPQALLVFFVLIICSFFILIQLPKLCFYYAVFALLLTIVYPFCKRFIQGPQLVLGLAFSMGIPMAFAASYQSLNANIIYLLLINYLWIVSYDTQYAMVDRDDDLRIGVKSTAILFANYDRLIIGLCQILFHFLWLVVAVNLHLSMGFWIYWLLASLILIYQQKLIIKRERENCFKAFNSNAYYGFIMWLALIFEFGGLNLL